jgi:hypothetical protein
MICCFHEHINYFEDICSYIFKVFKKKLNFFNFFKLIFDSLLLGIPFLSYLSFVNSNASGLSQNSFHFFICFRQEISEGNDIIGAGHLIAFD